MHLRVCCEELHIVQPPLARAAPTGCHLLIAIPFNDEQEVGTSHMPIQRIYALLTMH